MAVVKCTPFRKYRSGSLLLYLSVFAKISRKLVSPKTYFCYMVVYLRLLHHVCIPPPCRFREVHGDFSLVTKLEQFE